MQRILEFHIAAQTLPKKKDGYLSIGGPDVGVTPIPEGLEMYVWENKNSDKHGKFKVPADGILRIRHGRPYDKEFTLTFMFKLGLFAKSEKKTIKLKQPFDNIHTFNSAGAPTHSEVGGYAVFMTHIKSTHTSFAKPSIPEGLPHSRMLSIRCNTRTDVEWMTTQMEHMNAERVKRGLSLFEVVSVTHMGYYMAARDWVEKEVYYTLFYRMMRALPPAPDGNDEVQHHSPQKLTEEDSV